jgi:phosphate-selective porin OprO/OprP
LARELESLQAEVAKLREAESKRSAAETKKAAADETKPTMRTTAELQLDNYYFGQNTESRDTVGNIPDGAAFRRARVGILGGYQVTEYRLEMDFAQAGRPTFLDVWGAINELPVVGQLKVGNFFEPFGLERLTSNRYAPFLERNLPDQPFDPSRNPGVQFSSNYAEKRGLWAIGGFRGRNDNFGDAAADAGDYAVTGRITWLPYYDEASGGRYYMHWGTAHSYRRTANHTTFFQAQPEARLGADTVNVPFFVNTNLIAADNVSLHEVEFAASFGRCYVQSEYFLTSVDQLAGPQLWFTGWYAQAGWFLTGEHRPYRRDTATFDRVMPFSEFFRVRTKRGIARGPGAWELAARISHLDLTSANIGGGRLTDLTVGLNWYLTPYTKVQMNYVRAFLDPAASGRTGADIFGMRFHYDF